MAQQHTPAARRPFLTALSALLAAVAFLLLPSSTAGTAAQGQRPGGGAPVPHGTGSVQAAHGTGGPQFAYTKGAAHLTHGHIGSHPETAPPPPFPAPGAGEATRQRAHGGPAVPVGAVGHAVGRDVAVPQPRGPPSGLGGVSQRHPARSTQATVDA